MRLLFVDIGQLFAAVTVLFDSGEGIHFALDFGKMPDKNSLKH
jgi:hypothetical protein